MPTEDKFERRRTPFYSKRGFRSGASEASPTFSVTEAGSFAASGNGEITGTLAVTGTTTFTGAVTASAGFTGSAGNKKTVVDTGGAFATPIVLTAADSGKVYLLDDAAGLDFTLPAISASEVGVHFSFRLITEPTSNSYRFTAQSGDLLIGHVMIYDKDLVEGSTEALQQLNRPDGSDDLILTITGSDDTQGSLVGGWLEFEAVTATRWFVRGSLIGDGALATNFS